MDANRPCCHFAGRSGPCDCCPEGDMRFNCEERLCEARHHLQACLSMCLLTCAAACSTDSLDERKNDRKKLTTPLSSPPSSPFPASPSLISAALQVCVCTPAADTQPHVSVGCPQTLDSTDVKKTNTRLCQMLPHANLARGFQHVTAEGSVRSSRLLASTVNVSMFMLIPLVE